MSTPPRARPQADHARAHTCADTHDIEAPSPLRWMPAGVLVVLGVAYALPAGAVSGATQVLVIADIGPAVRWGQLVIGVVHNAAAAVTVGLLIIAGFLMPQNSRALTQTIRAAAWVGAIWASATLITMLVSFSEISAIMVDQGGYWRMLGANLLQIELTRLMAIEALLVWIVTALCVLAPTRARAAGAAVLSCIALIPMGYTGHSSASDGHETAVTALAIHLVSVSVWVGGLLGLMMLRGPLAEGLQVTAQRFSVLATWCFVGVGLSGVLFASGTIDEPSDLLDNYWLLIFVKVVAFTVLGVFGHLQRQRILAGGVDRPGAFVRLASTEMLVMALALGLAVALSRTPAPGSHDVDTTAVAQLTGFGEPAVLTLGSWAEVWRVNWLFLILAGVMAGAYLAGVRRVRDLGDVWATGRVIAWLVACAGLVYLTSGAPGVYGRVLFSVHMFIHVVLLFGLPVLMVLAAPLQLALRTLPARTDATLGPRECVQTLLRNRYVASLADPFLAASAVLLFLIGLYLTPALHLALTSHPLSVFSRVALMVFGCALVSALLQPRRSGLVPSSRWTGAAAALVGLSASCAVLGLLLIAAPRLLAADFFLALELTWGPSALADQRLGGVVLLIASVAFAVALGALMYRDPRPAQQKVQS
ncbi:MAG: cytochrome c oxidase assembly protein [Ornithinimicrobium sp.]